MIAKVAFFLLFFFSYLHLENDEKWSFCSLSLCTFCPFVSFSSIFISFFRPFSLVIPPRFFSCQIQIICSTCIQQMKKKKKKNYYYYYIRGGELQRLRRPFFFCLCSQAMYQLFFFFLFSFFFFFLFKILTYKVFLFRYPMDG